MNRARLISTLALAVSIAFSAHAQYTPEQAAGYKAGIMCSAVFTAKREPADVYQDELAGPELSEVLVGEPVIDYNNKAVWVPYPGADTPRLAVHHPGFGTVLLPPGATLPYRETLPEIELPFPEGDPAEIPWPDGDLLPDEALPRDINQTALDQAIELAFTGEKYAPHKTLGVVIVYNDRIIAERYAESWDMHTQYRSWSSAKSITNALVGIMVKDGKLDVHQPAPIPEWQSPDDPRREITIENLLHMSSGLQSDGAATGHAYWGGIDTAKAIATTPPEAEPGARWKYSNYDTLLLIRSIKEVIGKEKDYWQLPRKRLLNKIGMRNTFPEIDPYGNFILSSQMYTTPRDLARFGMLYLHDGVWNGERILPEGWVAYTQEPAPAKVNADERDWGYGKQFWLLGADPRVPEDTYTTAGARGQLSTIVPSRNLVVVRTGLDPRGEDNWDQVEFVADVLRALKRDT